MPTTPNRSTELYSEDPALQRWLSRLKSEAPSTRKQYIRYFRVFCRRFGYTPSNLYEARLAEVTSDDPLRWGVIRDQVLQVMTEMNSGSYFDEEDPWPQEGPHRHAGPDPEPAEEAGQQAEPGQVGNGIGQPEAAPDVTSPDPIVYFKACIES